jgi:hypothetical protein
MRSIPLIGLAAMLGSCSMAPQPVTRSPSGQRAMDSLLTGKVAGPPVSCLPSYNANDMSIIDGRTVAFRVGTGTVYMVRLNEGCGLLGSGNYALLTRPFGGMGLCRGDIAQVFDTMNRQTVGSCTVAAIVPYVRPGR